MLFCMACGAERNRITIAWLYADAAVGSGPHMRGLRRGSFAAGDAGKLTNKAEMLAASTRTGLRFAAREIAGNARGGHGFKRLRLWDSLQTCLECRL